MTEHWYSGADLADELGVARKTLRRKASKLGIGIDLEGRAGYRYSEDDRRKLIDSMRPAAPVPSKRRRRVA